MKIISCGIFLTKKVLFIFLMLTIIIFYSNFYIEINGNQKAKRFLMNLKSRF